MEKRVRRKRRTPEAVEKKVRENIESTRTLKPRKKRTKKETMTQSALEYKVLKFNELKEQKKLIEQQEKVLRDELEAYMQGLPKDPKGHSITRVLDSNGEQLSLQRQIRRKISVDEEALISYLKENDLNDYIIEGERIKPEAVEADAIEVLREHKPELIETFYSFEDKRVEKAVMEGIIPAEDFEDLCEIRETVVMAFVKEDE